MSQEKRLEAATSGLPFAHHAAPSQAQTLALSVAFTGKFTQEENGLKPQEKQEENRS
jgi:hypothetical protein